MLSALNVSSLKEETHVTCKFIHNNRQIHIIELSSSSQGQMSDMAAQHHGKRTQSTTICCYLW